MTARKEVSERERLARWMDRNAKGMWPDRQNNRDCRKIAALLRARPPVSKRERELMELGREVLKLKDGQDLFRYKNCEGQVQWWMVRQESDPAGFILRRKDQKCWPTHSPLSALRASRKGGK